MKEKIEQVNALIKLMNILAEEIRQTPMSKRSKLLEEYKAVKALTVKLALEL